MFQYAEAIENSIIFKDETDNVETAIVNSAFSLIDIRVYMKNEFIVKLGEHITDTYIILDGKANVFACYNNEFIGYLPVGYHFGNDLFYRKRAYFGHLSNEKLQLELDLDDNLDDKSVIHLVAD